MHGTALGGEYLTHSYAIEADVAAPFITAVKNRTAVAIERAAVGVLAFDADLEGVTAIGADAHYPGQFAFTGQVAAKAPVAHQRLCFRCAAQPVFPGRVVQRVTLGQQRHHLFTGQLKPVAVARQRLVLQRRPVAEVEVHQALPLLSRSTLQGHPCTGVAAPAHLAGLLVKRFDGVEAAFQRVTHPLGLARCEALSVGQVFDQGAAVVIADLQTVHGLHPGNAHQPPFRGLALMTDAAQGIVSFGRVTALTGFLEDGLGVAGCQAVGRMQRNSTRHD
ncbi:hypothetical protein D3C79_680040 [compost metagenome]